MRRRTRWMAGVASAALLAPSVAASAPLAAASPRPPLHAGPLTGPVLSLGDEGEAVKVVQRQLRVAVDGRFGPRTRQAVQRLQAAAGLKPDGVVGPLTWAALESARTGGGGARGRPVLSLGATGAAVTEAQRALTRRGFRVGADGVFGARTAAAVTAFQRERGLTADGVVGPRTWEALDSAVQAQQVRAATLLSDAWRSIGSRSYVVRSGDTWTSIAAAKGSTAAALATANRMDAGRRPPVGSTLRVPGSWQCPTPQGKFINDYGFPRPGGRLHQGNDLFAPRGTPIRAPVSGRADQSPNPIGGNAVQLYGDDGNRYYFAHLESFGAQGKVAAGDLIGYVGNSGNAITTQPHLHLEVHPNGGAAINPFPTITLACRR